MSALYCYREILAGSEWGSVKEMKGCGYVLALAAIFSLGTINRGAYHELIYIWLGAAVLMALMLVLERRAQKIADQEYEEAQNYIEKVYGDIASLSRSMKTANPAVNALLQVKLAACEKRGIPLILDITSR